jgi:dolichol-phosphate mannosyltransferase|tara:strand:- start:1464 stop:2174 length:711 start_codon:yes stop_codon:yes gene_type:complete
MIKLDIVIPVYNEDKNIVRLLETLESEIVCNFRVLICYDRDNDTTLKKLKNKKVTNKEILLIKNPKKGPNSAIIEGINSSKAEIILIYMADDFENIKLINKMINLIEDGNELIIPSRFIPGGKMLGAKKIKKMITVIGSYSIYYLAKIPFRDCTNAFKMFSVSLKDKIKLDSTKGFTFALELTTKSYFSNLKIIEIPCVWIETKNKKSNFKLYKWLPYYIYWLMYSIIRNFFRRQK